MDCLTLRIAYPPPELNKNNQNGLHWAIVDSHRQDQEDEAYLLTKSASSNSSLIFGDTPVFISWLFYPPDLKKRDEDNLDMKGAQDGIFKALGFDDSNVAFTVRKMMREKDPDKKGYVEIRIGIPDESFNILWR